jgi:hypothetical protein
VWVVDRVIVSSGSLYLAIGVQTVTVNASPRIIHFLQPLLITNTLAVRDTGRLLCNVHKAAAVRMLFDLRSGEYAPVVGSQYSQFSVCTGSSSLIDIYTLFDLL